MKQLTLLLLIFQSVHGISQVDYLTYSNLLLFEPASIENNRIEVCDYFISTYGEQANNLQSEIDKNMRHKDRDMIETEIQLLTDYIKSWDEARQEHPLIEFLNIMNELECYQVSSKHQNYANSEITIQENEFWKRDKNEILEVKIEIIKAPGDAEWVKVNKDAHMRTSEENSEKIACLKQEKSFLFQIDNEEVTTERLPSNFRLDEEKEYAIFQMELAPLQYELISLNNGKRIEMESWKEVDCE